MNVQAIVKRIIKQLVRDKRSMALMLMAPIFVITLLWLVLDMDAYEPTIAVTDIPEHMSIALEDGDAEILEMTETGGKEALENETADAHIILEGETLHVTMEGSDSLATTAVQRIINQATEGINKQPFSLEIDFLHGSTDLNMFDHVGPVLIGFFVFFFTFIIGGVSFLRERTQGTLERLLATPLKRWQIVIGYLIGFGLFILLQSVLVTIYSVYVLGMYMEGAIIEVLIIALLLAVSALSLGTLLSAYAKNEFQMIQFIPIIIVPQVFFAGIFHVESVAWMEAIGKIMPLYYGGNALSEIMLRGGHLVDIWSDIAVLAAFSFVFILLNIFALKRHRAL
ncbi:ABC transporter permease [Lentibacillus saliphilus]|uniref:ABC transporter permease n=1 Tax=Lentibacillus saliphilus TaxID=2737028 RepID=UPI001C309B56|nr:ABC transporter permease [Lentibacillus saliphilus]